MANEWAGLQSVVMVERTRRLWHKTTHDVQFYLSSLPPNVLKLLLPFVSIGALDLLGESFPGEAGKRFTLTKKHSRKKSIENGLYWSLDVTLGKMPVG